MKKHGRLVSVVTADVIDSRQYRQTERSRLDKAIRSGFLELRKRYRRDLGSPLGFRFTAGDEFQWVVSNPSRVLEIVIYMRAVLAIQKFDPPARFRASVGVGEATVAKRGNPYAEDGPAFVRSREGLNVLLLTDRPKRWTKLVTGKRDPDDSLDVILSFLDYLQQRWTRAQWEAVRWTLVGLKREQIASEINVAHQNVTKRLAAAEWDRFRGALYHVSSLLDRLAP